MIRRTYVTSKLIEKFDNSVFSPNTNKSYLLANLESEMRRFDNQKVLVKVENL